MPWFLLSFFKGEKHHLPFYEKSTIVSDQPHFMSQLFGEGTAIFLSKNRKKGITMRPQHYHGNNA